MERYSPISYTENKIVDNLLNYILQEYRHQLKKLEISVHLPPYIGAELFDAIIVIGIFWIMRFVVQWNQGTESELYHSL